MHVHDRCCSLAGRFSTYLLAFNCTKWELCLCIKNLEPKLFQMSPLYLATYIRYYPAVLSKFACATSKKLIINILFVCLDRSWNDRRWSASSMLSGLFSGWVFIHSPLHEKRAVIGIPSPKLQKELITNQTKTPNGVKTFTFITWEPPLACLAWY